MNKIDPKLIKLLIFVIVISVATTVLGFAALFLFMSPMLKNGNSQPRIDKNRVVLSPKECVGTINPNEIELEFDKKIYFSFDKSVIYPNCFHSVWVTLGNQSIHISLDYLIAEPDGDFSDTIGLTDSFGQVRRARHSMIGDQYIEYYTNESKKDSPTSFALSLGKEYSDKISVRCHSKNGKYDKCDEFVKKLIINKK